MRAALAVTVLAWAICTSLAVDERRPIEGTPQAAAAAETPTERRREGDRFEGPGRFEVTGDRITFYTADGLESFRVVENLALERVARVLEDPAEAGQQRVWQIRAEVLEYRGANYLRLERVILKSYRH